MSQEKEICFWDLDDVEILRYDDFDEAVEMILNDYHPSPIPATIDIWGWKRKVVTIDEVVMVESLSESLHEYLEENFGYEDPITESSAFHEYAKEFIEKCLKVYTPWQCEKVKKITVNTRDWVEKNAPEWLEENPDLISLS